MALTYEVVSKITVGSGGVADIELTNIPSTYTDLLLKTSLRSDRAGVTDGALMLYAFNGDAGATLTRKWLLGNGSTASSASATSSNNVQISSIPASNGTVNTFSNDELYIPNYASSNLKPFSFDSVSENNLSTGLLFMTAGLWSNTAAITSIRMIALSGNFVQHSTATLYGIKNS